MAFDPGSAKEVMAFDPNSAQEYKPPEAPTTSGVLDKLANNPVIEGINAIGGGAQQGLSNVIGTASGSDTIKNLTPPEHVQEAMLQNPTLAQAGAGIGMAMGSAPASGIGMAVSAPLVAQGLLTEGGATALGNIIAGSTMAGPNNRILGGVIGAGTSLVGPLVSSSMNFITKAATLATRVKNVVSEIGSKIEGTPDTIAAKSQANMWTAADATDKQNFSFLNDANKSSTVPQQAATQAQKVLQKYEDPKVLGDLSGPQRQIVEQIASWSKQENKVIPASSILDSSGNAVQGETNQIINSNTKFSLSELQNARKGLDQAISQAFNQSENGAIAKGVAMDLLSIRNPIEQDLLQAATKAGVKDQYLQANNFYKSSVLPLINTGARDTADALKNAGTDPLAAAKITDGLINKYINPAKPDVAKTFLNTLDPIGRQAVEAQVVNNAMKKATNNIDKIDPLVFKTNIENLQKQLGSVFSPETNKMLQGVNKAIDQGTTFLGMKLDLAKIQTGYKIGAAASAMGGLAYTAGGGTAAAFGTLALGLNKLIQSKVGQDLLIRAGTKGGEEVGKQIVNSLLIQGALAITPPDIKGQQ